MRRMQPTRQNLEARERQAANWRKWNEVRPWWLTCPACEHEGCVETTLKRLRSANIKCSECGAYLWKAG